MSGTKAPKAPAPDANIISGKDCGLVTASVNAIPTAIWVFPSILPPMPL